MIAFIRKSSGLRVAALFIFAALMAVRPEMPSPLLRAFVAGLAALFLFPVLFLKPRA